MEVKFIERNGGEHNFKIESPIEIMMIKKLEPEVEKLNKEYDNLEISINPQFPIKLDNKIYRVDISLGVLYVDLKNPRYDFSGDFFIECDGYNYHYKNKKQVTRDRKRERKLMDKCCKFIRFTGTEIYKNTEGCVNELLEMVKKRVLPRKLIK